MMFASKTPRDLNHDPEPWHDPRPGTSLFRGDGPWGHAFYDPRPEFDHVQHNEPNPILVDVRAHADRASYDSILRAFSYVVAEAGHFVTKDWDRVTDERQIEHARKVLARLVTAEVSS